MFDISAAEVAVGILLLHLFFFIGFQYQLLNLLEEIAYPTDDPIMTSSLELNYSSDVKAAADAELEEAVEEAEIEIEEAVEEWDEPEDFVCHKCGEEADGFDEDAKPLCYDCQPEEELLDKTKCLGVAKSGKQCGRGPKPDSTYCHLHQ